MNELTVKLIESILKTDTSLGASERRRRLKNLCGDTPATAPAPVPVEPRIYSRKEAGHLLGDKTPRFVDLLARKGLLKKVVLAGSQRAIGISGSSLQQLLTA